jgi:hypothetical protein
MSEISIYRALFPRQKLFPIIIILVLQSISYAVSCPISVTLLCLPVLFLVVNLKINLQSVQLLRRNLPIYPAALLHIPTWLKRSNIEYFFYPSVPILVPYLESILVPPSVTQKPIVCLIRYHPALQISDLEGTYKHPCASRPLYKKELYSFHFFFTTFLRENTPLYPSFALLSPCVAKRY